jgi:hypothetical protein
MNSYPAPLPTKRTAGQQERVVVKWTVYVALRDENICQFDKVRLLVDLSKAGKCRTRAIRRVPCGSLPVDQKRGKWPRV